MHQSIEIHPCGPLNGSIRPPGSKSLTNRALLCAALAEGESELRDVLDSEDTRVMIAALQELGLHVTVDLDARRVSIVGCDGRLGARNAELFLANSGTSLRFLTALATIGEGQYRLDGVARMRERPIQDLADALVTLGAEVRCEGTDGCPPVQVRGTGLEGGAATIRGNISSQFLSALLMVAPYARNDVHLHVEGELVSQPYIRMTTAVMQAFGVSVDTRDLREFLVTAGQRYRGRQYAIEPDASAASYFWAAAAITGGRVSVEGLSRESLQGDVAFCDCLEKMGCQVIAEHDRITVIGGQLQGIHVDMNAISDTVQTLAAVAVYAEGETRITGVAHIRYKETDRIGDLARELRKLGAFVEELPDGLRIIPGHLRGAEIETYNDHRMAMSLALTGLRTPGIVIQNPSCTEKTYPRFFDDFRHLCS